MGVVVEVEVVLWGGDGGGEGTQAGDVEGFLGPR